MGLDQFTKRMWVSIPKTSERWARAVVRSVWNADVSENPLAPYDSVSPRNHQFELYYHRSIVDELKRQIEELKKGKA